MCRRRGGSRYGPTAGEPLYALGSIANDTVVVRWYATDTTNRAGSIHISYIIK